MIKQISSLAATVCLAGALSTTAFAAEHQVLMLNALDSQYMVFEPALLNVAVGDTVKFIAKDAGHNAETITGLLPEGATGFKGTLSSDLVVTIDKEGVYVVQCNPHAMMAMVAVIVAGKPTNLASIQEKSVEYSSKFVVGKDRLSKILAQVK